MCVFGVFVCGEGGGHVCVVGLVWRHWASVLDDFKVIWGTKMKLKSILKHLVGPMAPPRGFLRAQGCHFGRFWGRFRVIWGAKLEPKIGLGASGGPHGSPQGCYFGECWVHFGVISKTKSCQNE